MTSDRPSRAGRTTRQLSSDLRTEPHLTSLFGAAFVLAAFWFWHRDPGSLGQLILLGIDPRQ